MGQKKLNSPIMGWQEGAGGLLLLAAAHETALLSQLEDVLPMKQPSSAVPQPSPQRLFHPHRRLLLTLLFLPAVGLHRFWHLRSYTGRELALLTGRPRPYSYRHTERFLLMLALAQADQALTKALARWTSTLWQVETRSQEASSPHFYVDGHRKAVYTKSLIPRGLIGKSGKILGCRSLVLLHDDQGHPLLVTTQRGDLHLTNGIPQVLTDYEQATEALHLARLVVDREAMAADFLAQLSTEGRTMITLLKTNQYSGLDSFTNVGAFVPLTLDRHGAVLTRPSLPLSFSWLVLIAAMNPSDSWQRVYRVQQKSHQESVKHEKYCREQRELLRALEDLAANERVMYELDNRKDQIMTVYKLALTNLAMWVRDRFFPSTYAHATWQRLQPFFRLPGRIHWGPDAVQIDLRPFNNRQLTRDLLAVCQRVNEIQPRLPDGRLLILHAPSSPFSNNISGFG